MHHDERLGDGHGGVGEVVRAVCVEACFDLLGLGVAMMLDVAVFKVAVEGFEVEEGGDVRVGRGAVVAFVEVVREDLPVVGAVDFVRVVEDVVVEVDAFVALLSEGGVLVRDARWSVNDLGLTHRRL